MRREGDPGSWDGHGGAHLGPLPLAKLSLRSAGDDRWGKRRDRKYSAGDNCYLVLRRDGAVLRRISLNLRRFALDPDQGGVGAPDVGWQGPTEVPLQLEVPSSPDIVAIGASAGGIGAMSRLVQALPPGLPASVLLVVHRAPDIPSRLKEVVQFHSHLRIEIPADGAPLQHGVGYVAPVGRHLSVSPGPVFHLLPDGFYRASSIDVLFQSLARCTGARTIGVVLSGMLKDGSLGLKAVKDAGGITMVQDPREAAFPDMPMNAIAHDGPVDFIGPISELAREICRRVGVPATAAP